MIPINLLALVYFPPGVPGQLREAGFRESLLSWKKHLQYDGDLNLLLVNDGPALLAYSEWGGTQQSLGHTRNGIGASWNQGLAAAFANSPLVLNICDDSMLRQPYALTAWAKMLLADEQIGAVRLSAPYPGTSGNIQPRAGGWIVLLERHNLVAGQRPSLYHRRFFDAYGAMDEGLSAWETERLFNERFCQATGPESVFALPVPWTEGRGASVLLGQQSPEVAEGV